MSSGFVGAANAGNVTGNMPQTSPGFPFLEEKETPTAPFGRAMTPRFTMLARVTTA